MAFFIPYIKSLVRDPLQVGRRKLLELRWLKWTLSIPYYIPSAWRDTHVHCLGLTGSGKSTLLTNLFTQDVLANRGCGLIDPDEDLAFEAMRRLIHAGFFGRYRGLDGAGKAVFDWNDAHCQRVIYFEPARRSDRVIPFNILNNPTFKADELAGHITEAFKRAWSSIKDGPRFISVLYPALLLLIQAGLTLPDLYSLLEDPEFRGGLLLRTSDRQLVRMFLDEFKLWHQTQADNNESVTNKLTFHMFNESVRRSMGVVPNVINPTTIMDEGKVLIVNLRYLSDPIQRLLGSLITVMFEQAALNRPESGGRRQFYYYLDEFTDYCEATSLARVLSRCRKRNFRVLLFHQTLGQLQSELSDVLANVGLFLPFVTSPNDAKVMVHLLKTRSTSWESDISNMQELRRHCFYIRKRDPSMLNVLVTEPPPKTTVTPQQLDAVITHLEELHGVPAPTFEKAKHITSPALIRLPHKIWAQVT